MEDEVRHTLIRKDVPAHRKIRSLKKVGAVIGGGILFAFFLAVSLFIGDNPIRPSDVLRALADPENPVSARVIRIFWSIRAPRAILAATVGASLGLAGALMQSILGNPLASPFSLGVSSAAGFGASLAIVSGFSILNGSLAIIGNAFAFSILASLGIYAAAVFAGATPIFIVLTGMGISFLFSSLTTLLQYFSTPEAVYRAIFWTAGSLSLASWRASLTVLAVLAASLCASLPMLYDLSLIVEGDKQAASVGVHVRRIRLVCLGIASLLAATTVSLVGVIGFIGLAAPHIARLLGLRDPVYLVPFSAAAGGILLLAADMLSTRILPPVILPIGAITSLVGVPFFFFLIFSGRRGLWRH